MKIIYLPVVGFIMVLAASCSWFDRDERMNEAVNQASIEMTVVAKAVDPLLTALAQTPAPAEITQSPEPTATLLPPMPTPTEQLSGKDQPGDQNESPQAWCENTPDLGDLSPRWPESIGRWAELIRAESCNYNIDPNAVAAAIHTLSSGNPAYVNDLCGTGLMGVMPSNSLCGDYGGLFKDRPTQEELVDPVFNVKYMTPALAAKVRELNSYEKAFTFYYGEFVGGKIISAWQEHLP